MKHREERTKDAESLLCGTCSGSLYGLWMFIRGEKLLFTGTLAPMKGRSL